MLSIFRLSLGNILQINSVLPSEIYEIFHFSASYQTLDNIYIQNILIYLCINIYTFVMYHLVASLQYVKRIVLLCISLSDSCVDCISLCLFIFYWLFCFLTLTHFFIYIWVFLFSHWFAISLNIFNSVF